MLKTAWWKIFSLVYLHRRKWRGSDYYQIKSRKCFVSHSQVHSVCVAYALHEVVSGKCFPAQTHRVTACLTSGIEPSSAALTRQVSHPQVVLTLTVILDLNFILLSIHMSHHTKNGKDHSLPMTENTINSKKHYLNIANKNESNFLWGKDFLWPLRSVSMDPNRSARRYNILQFL